jgi:hypothetical protein
MRGHYFSDSRGTAHTECNHVENSLPHAPAADLPESALVVFRLLSCHASCLSRLLSRRQKTWRLSQKGSAEVICADGASQRMGLQHRSVVGTHGFLALNVSSLHKSWWQPEKPPQFPNASGLPGPVGAYLQIVKQEGEERRERGREKGGAEKGDERERDRHSFLYLYFFVLSCLVSLIVVWGNVRKKESLWKEKQGNGRMDEKRFLKKEIEE